MDSQGSHSTDPAPGPESRRTATSLLSRSAQGDELAGAELLPLLYDELHRLAGAYLRRERPDHTLQATALLNEAWMRLIDRRRLERADREHFLALAAQAMRRVLVNHARDRNAQKRGRGWEKITLSEVDASMGGEGLDLVEIDDLIQRLSAEDEHLGQLVTLRFFGGLGHAEIAQLLGVSERTVHYHWQFARGWLTRELRGGEAR